MTMGRFVYQFPCPVCGGHTVLPRRSPLGTYGELQYQPTDAWPINFLCFHNGQVSQVPRGAIRPDTLVTEQIPTPGAASLWQIQCECAHENCGKRHTIYSKYSTDAQPSDVGKLLFQPAQSIPCTSTHALEIRVDTVTADRLDF